MSLNLALWRESALLGALVEETVRGLQANIPELVHYGVGAYPKPLPANRFSRLFTHLDCEQRHQVTPPIFLQLPCFVRRSTMNSHTILALAIASVLAAPPVPAQTCNPHIRRSAPDDRYIVNAAKGTVLDKQTGLMWKRCIEGRSGADCGTGSPIELNWSGALSQAAASVFSGYKDWRVPNSKELESLVEVACYKPTINAIVFPNDPSIMVWASSPHNEEGKTWFVGFDDGRSHFIYRDFLPWHASAVRLVRGGQ